MTNTQKIETATEPYIGQTLSAKAFQLITQEMYPGTPSGSLLISDHSRVRLADGSLGRKPGQANVYADGLFEATGTGYKRLPANEIQRKESTRNSRSMSDSEILSRAKALIAKQDAKQDVPAPSAELSDAELDAATSPTV